MEAHTVQQQSRVQWGGPATAGGMSRPERSAFRHEAFFHAGDDEFLSGVLPFICEGIDGDEAVLVAVDRRRSAMLQETLGDESPRVGFIDMRELGANPARLIPAWDELVQEQAERGRAMRALSQLAWPRRGEAELEECHRHESLLNHAFRAGHRWQLLCAYDTAVLDDTTLARACCTHPFVREGGALGASMLYEASPQPYAGTLPEPNIEPTRLAFTIGRLGELRKLVFRAAREALLSYVRAEDLTLAVDELAVNSLLHGGGEGTLRVWRDQRSLVCEVHDRGHMVDPMAGRTRPGHEQMSGRGLWLVNSACDLVEIRSCAEHGTTVRVRMDLD